MERGTGRVGRVLVMAGVLVIAGSGSALSQSSAPDEAARLKAACATNARNEVQRATCEWVVDTVLVPQARGSVGPSGADPEIGVALTSGAEQVTLVEVEWDAAARGARPPREKGSRLVAVRLREAAIADGATVDPGAWTLVDGDGFAWAQVDRGMTPTLAPAGALPAGTIAKGWVTFAAPKALHEFTLTDGTDGGLRWHLVEEACPWVRLRPKGPPIRFCLPTTDPQPDTMDPTDVPMPVPGSSIPPVAPGAPGSLPSRPAPSPSPSPAS